MVASAAKSTAWNSRPEVIFFSPLRHVGRGRFSPLVEPFRSSREFFSLQQNDRGLRTVVLQLWHDAHDEHVGCLSLRLSLRLGRSIRELDLCPVHGSLLRLSVGEIFTFGDRLGLSDTSGHVIDNDFGKLSVLRGIDGKLNLAVFDLKFSGNRLAFPFAGRKALLQTYLYAAHCVCQLGLFFIRANCKS